MAKYALIGGYTAEAWSKMIDNPGGRMEAARKVIESVGAKLEVYYWCFGEDDYLGIIEAPDDTTAGAVAIAMGSSGSLRNLRTIRLITQEEGKALLEKAKTAKAAYAPPGSRQAAGVH
jgi:uncharacterized protein with GYD domain